MVVRSVTTTTTTPVVAPATPIPKPLTSPGINFEKIKALMISLSLAVLSGYQFWKGNDANGLTVFALFIMSAGGSTSAVSILMGLGAAVATTHRLATAVEASQISSEHTAEVVDETNLRVQDIQNNPVMPGTPQDGSYS
jgi:hypothetical protein